MKTLDEVIDTLEHPSKAVFEPDGFSLVHSNDLADALHYLKEYQGEFVLEARANLADKFVNALIESEDNPALTWDELREMEGKPVWVEYDGYTPEWEVIENVGAMRGSIGDITGTFIETHMSVLHKDDMGKTWQAYRKEREI